MPSQPARQALERHRAKLRRNPAQVETTPVAYDEEPAPATDLHRNSPSASAFKHLRPMGGSRMAPNAGKGRALRAHRRPPTT